VSNALVSIVWVVEEVYNALISIVEAGVEKRQVYKLVPVRWTCWMALTILGATLWNNLPLTQNIVIPATAGGK
jgi:hypothetical protein